jgi:hypothetical protein
LEGSIVLDCGDNASVSHFLPLSGITRNFYVGNYVGGQRKEDVFCDCDCDCECVCDCACDCDLIYVEIIMFNL